MVALNQIPRTELATAGLQISDLVAAKFGDQRLGPLARSFRLIEPDGPSTGGGTRARQSLVLAAADRSVRPIVCGWFDVVQRELEVRSFGDIAYRFEQRHSTTIDVSKAEYDDVVDALRDFLALQGVSSTVAESPPAPPPPPEIAPQPSFAPLLFAAAMVLASVFLGYLVLTP